MFVKPVGLINAHANVCSEARGLNLGLSLHLHPYFVNASSEGSSSGTITLFVSFMLWFLCTIVAKLVICLYYSLFTLKVVSIYFILFSLTNSILSEFSETPNQAYFYANFWFCTRTYPAGDSNLRQFFFC